MIPIQHVDKRDLGDLDSSSMERSEEGVRWIDHLRMDEDSGWGSSIFRSPSKNHDVRLQMKMV